MSLSQGNNLYIIREADHHSLFMELSSLLLDGVDGDCEIDLVNFLHRITSRAESESLENMLNNQKVPKLPDEEPVWALSTVSSLVEDEISLPSDYGPSSNEHNMLSLPKRKTGNSNWPPAGWKNAPDFNYPPDNDFMTKPAQISSFSDVKVDDNSEGIGAPPVCYEQGSVYWNVTDDTQASSVSLALHENENFKNQSYHDFEPITFHPLEFNPVSLGEDMDESQTGAQFSSPACSNSSFAAFNMPDRLQDDGTFDAAQAKKTGDLGEKLAYKYFADKYGNATVRWVNEREEKGSPFDLTIGEGANIEYIEVKATRSQRKDWFHISVREWQYAIEKGDSYSIAFVVITGNDARVAVFKNPAKLCRQGGLQLVVMIPKQQRQLPGTS
jgi:hypothetical protein